MKSVGIANVNKAMLQFYANFIRPNKNDKYRKEC